MWNNEYKVIRSNRKTLGLQVSDKGVVVRAPFAATEKQISDFVKSNTDWIKNGVAKIEEHNRQMGDLKPITPDEIRELASQALAYIPERVKFYAQKMGVTYGRVTIRNQISKWGSCSGKGNLNFNCLLMLAPPEVIDSVVVHELCHLKEMNHSDKFYAEVLKVYPDYHKWHGWLTQNGGKLVARMRMGMQSE